MEEILNKLYGYVAEYGLSFVAAILIFVIGKWLARILSNVLEKLMIKANVEKTLASFTKNIAYVALLVFVIIAEVVLLGRVCNSSGGQQPLSQVCKRFHFVPLLSMSSCFCQPLT